MLLLHLFPLVRTSAGTMSLQLEPVTVQLENRAEPVERRHGASRTNRNAVTLGAAAPTSHGDGSPPPASRNACFYCNHADKLGSPYSGRSIPTPA